MKSNIPVKAGDPIPKCHRWYYNEKFDYVKYLKLKGKVTAYFKVVMKKGGTGGRIHHIFYKVHESGLIIYVNMTMMKIGVTQGVISPSSLFSSNKREFDKNFNNLITLLQ